jgi:hypothetical protein
VIRWGHGHSTLLGVLLGLVLFRGWGVVWGLTCLFGLGIVVGRFWDHLRAFLRRGLPVLVEGRFRRL